MNTVRLLMIGNSFSQDAAAYLHQLAEIAGHDLKVVNLYIGGCPLERHWQNIEQNASAYQYQVNGTETERYVSIDEILSEESWDMIATQQASHDSGWLDTYEPFLGLLILYIKEKNPAARLLLQETWAYETGSTHEHFIRYHRNQLEMYARLHHCYTEMAKKYNLELVPCGTVIQQIRQLPPFCVAQGGMSLCRDGFHMSLSYGRYLLACVWIRQLFGLPLRDTLPIKDIRALPEAPMLTKYSQEGLLSLIRENVDDYFET